MIRFCLGAVLAGVVLIPMIAAASAWRRRLLPEWSGALGVLAQTVMVLSAIICASEMLGAIGQFRLGPTTVFLTAIGIGGYLASLRRQPGRNTSSIDLRQTVATVGGGVDRPSRSARFVALSAVSLVVADWGSRTADAVHHGMSTPDTLWYHMPFAARFVQDGSITALHFVDAGVDLGSEVPFYPANGELVHALGIMFFGTDVLSPLVNLGWLALLLLAAWCVGRPFGAGPVTLTGGAVLMATPGLVATQPGGAYTDIVGLALLVSAVALLLSSDVGVSRSYQPGMLIAALAAGLALGTKFTFILPVAALTLGVIGVSPRGTRVLRGSSWGVFVLLTGGFWYVRNIVAIGNPLPSPLHVGPIRLSSPPTPPETTVFSFLFNGHDWRQWLFPGIRESLGPAWWAIAAMSVAGLLIGAFATSSPIRRMLSLVGIASGIAFVFTPQILTLPGFYPHQPYNFVFNLRYSFASVVFGLVILPVIPITATFRRQWFLLGSYGLVVIVTQLDSTLWPLRLLSPQFQQPITGIDSLIGLIIGVMVFAIGSVMLLDKGNRAWASPSRLALVAVPLAVILFGLSAEHVYLADRYKNEPLSPLYTWAAHLRNSRIAIIGAYSNISYPLYGQDDSNYVNIVGKSGPTGSFEPVRTCSDLRRTLNENHFAYLIIVAAGIAETREPSASDRTQWITQDPQARLIFHRNVFHRSFGVSVFHIGGKLNPAGCPARQQ